MFARRLCVLLLAAILAAPFAVSAQQPAAPAPTLYHRLGGYDAIARLVDDTFPKLRQNPLVAPTFVGVTDAGRRRNRQLIVDQICQLTGGPCFYIGRTMEASHQHLKITAAQWDVFVTLLGEAMTRMSVRDPERGELLALMDALRPDIIEKSGATGKP